MLPHCTCHPSLTGRLMAGYWQHEAGPGLENVGLCCPAVPVSSRSFRGRAPA